MTIQGTPLLIDARLPNRAYPNDAGADVYCNGKLTLEPGEIKAHPLQFAIDIPEGHMGVIMCRSGLAKKGVVCFNSPIDPGYDGNVHAIVGNFGTETQSFGPNDRIGQLVIVPVVDARITSKQILHRGSNGFGSTGGTGGK